MIIQLPCKSHSFYIFFLFVMLGCLFTIKIKLLLSKDHKDQHLLLNLFCASRASELNIIRIKCDNTKAHVTYFPTNFSVLDLGWFWAVHVHNLIFMQFTARTWSVMKGIRKLFYYQLRLMLQTRGLNNMYRLMFGHFSFQVTLSELIYSILPLGWKCRFTHCHFHGEVVKLKYFHNLCYIKKLDFKSNPNLA